MNKTSFIHAIFIYILTCINVQAQIITEIEAEVADVERAFAKTMADRSLDDFANFIAPDAIFWGGNGTLRGKEAVIEGWRTLYEGEKAPFSWEPETVLVIEGGNLALSTGPVRNEAGEIFSYYTSTWRKNADGKWKVIFDKGQKYCP